jgi:hypothetical protein
MLGFLVLGYASQFLLPFSLTTLPFYDSFLIVLLAVGLYGSVYGISLVEFKEHKLLIAKAISIGVVLKSLLSGSVFWLLFGSPESFVLGIIVAQIDPLSVAHLVESKSKLFSQSGKTILRAWSSFDDPMTVLLCFYVFVPLVLTNVSMSISEYLLQLGTNLVFAGAFYLLVRILPSFRLRDYLLLIIAFSVGVYFELMLGVAILGLFLRPSLVYLDRVVHYAFIIATIILGTLLVFSWIAVIQGIVLGVLAFVGQYIVSQILARHLSDIDRNFLALAQFNGITSIILALLVERYFPGTVVVIGVALMVINSLFLYTNMLYEAQLNKRAVVV